jgi:hypothetical protein
VQLVCAAGRCRAARELAARLGDELGCGAPGRPRRGGGGGHPRKRAARGTPGYARMAPAGQQQALPFLVPQLLPRRPAERIEW